MQMQRQTAALVESAQEERFWARHIQPGFQVVRCISALPGGNAEEVLRIIARPFKGSRMQRAFGAWTEAGLGILQCAGRIGFVDKDEQEGRAVTLRIMRAGQTAPGGLVLEDTPGNNISIKDSVRGASRERFVIKVGEGVPQDRLEGLAHEIAVCWVVHGTMWTDRVRNVCNWPYGDDPRRRFELAFEVADGGAERLSLRTLIGMGLTRSAHAGQWNRPSTLIPAACGVPITLHEFREHSEGVCVFRSHRIGSSPDQWGPYCAWASDDRCLGPGAGAFQDIARGCASPFAFHLHATKRLFPQCALESANFLDRLGEDLLQRLLARMAVHEPERFYRLIDPDGRTHRLLGVRDDTLVFKDGREFRIAQAPENVFETFQDLAAIEEDPAFEIPRTARLVMDTHAYLVLQAIVCRQPEVYHLSGGDMYRYLTEGGDAEMHARRNERLWRVLGPILKAEKVRLHIYPSTALQCQPGENQYTFNPARFDREEWLGKALV